MENFVSLFKKTDTLCLWETVHLLVNTYLTKTSKSFKIRYEQYFSALQIYDCIIMGKNLKMILRETRCELSHSWSWEQVIFEILFLKIKIQSLAPIPLQFIITYCIYLTFTQNLENIRPNSCVVCFAHQFGRLRKIVSHNTFCIPWRFQCQNWCWLIEICGKI